MAIRVLEVPPSHRIEDLALGERAAPSSPSSGQILVRISAVSLNYRDLLVATAHDRWAPPAGRVLGSDAVGTVTAVGPGTDRFKIGDRVISTILPKWTSGPLTEQKRHGGLGGPAADGVFAEHVMIEASGAVLAPAYLSDKEAATLPVAALTAWHALRRGEVLRQGAIVLIEGAGGVSTFALQIAVAAGAEVIALSRSNAKLDRMRALGAKATLNSRDHPEWGQTILDMTNGRGVDLVVDIGGASTLNQAIQATAIGGTVSLVGLVGGARAETNLADVFQKNLRLDGIETGSRAMFEEMISWFEDKQIRPVIDKTFRFEEAREAFLRLQGGEHFGKITLTIDPPVAKPL